MGPEATPVPTATDNAVGQRTGLILAQYVPLLPPHDGKAGVDAHYDALQQTTYDYDEDRRLSAIESNDRPVLTYKYDADGRPILKTYGNGVRATLSYDAAGRLAGISFVGGPIAVPLNLTYEWDSADQVVQRTWNGETLRYQYDAAGRLARVLQVKGDTTTREIEGYAYDKAGNITKKTLQGQVTTLTYNAANELTSTSSGGGTTTYTYDKAGRLISSTGGPTNTYGWLDKVVRTHRSGLAFLYFASSIAKRMGVGWQAACSFASVSSMSFWAAASFTGSFAWLALRQAWLSGD